MIAQSAKPRSTLSAFFHYVSLNMLAMLGTSCYILADTFFIANGIGKVGLTALNLVLPAFTLINATGLMIGIGGATKYAIFKARGASKNGEQIFFHACLLAGIASALFVSLGLFAASPISHLLGSNAETHDMMVTYLRPLFCFAPLFLYNQLLTAFVRNDGAPNRAMAATMIGTFCNIVLDYLFIFPLHMGMLGAVLATACAPLVGIGMQLFYLRTPSCQLRFRIHHIQISFFKPVFLLGASEWITEMASGIVMLCFNLVILKETGNTGVAAYGILANIAMVASCLFTGIAQGVQPLLSHHYGKGEQKPLRQLLRMTLLTALLFAILLYGILYFFNAPIVSLFNTDGNPTLQDMAERGIRIYFLAFFFVGGNVTASTFFSAIERPAFSLCISLLRSGIVLLPLVFCFAAIWHLHGIWASYPVTESIICLFAYTIIIYNIRRKIS
jgi:putative MATE family efflux protein